MKAQVFRGVNQLSYEELPVPAIAPDEVLVQVRVWVSRISKDCYPPMSHRIFWHETAGVIAAVGNEVINWEVGQRLW